MLNTSVCTLNDDSICKWHWVKGCGREKEKKVLLIFSFALKKSLILIIMSLKNMCYFDWVIIDVLMQSLLETCRSPSSNFKGYWLNLEQTVFTVLFLSVFWKYLSYYISSKLFFSWEIARDWDIQDCSLNYTFVWLKVTKKSV